MSRTIVVTAASAKKAEEKARNVALFARESPIDRDDIDETRVGWVNPEPAADPTVVHHADCWGNHCRHYGCVTDETAIDHHAYCSQCDLGAY